MKLGDIAKIRSGLILSRKKATIKYEIKKLYKLITLKDIQDVGLFNMDNIETFESNEELACRYFTKEGDILIRFSAPYTAIYIDREIEGLLIPSYFAIIRLNSKEFLPKYVSWYLNSDQVKRELTRSQAGTAMATTNNRILASINIKRIPLDEQKSIAKVRDLYLRERGLLDRLIGEKDKYYQAITKELIKRN